MTDKTYYGYKVPITKVLEHSHYSNEQWGEWEEHYSVWLERNEVQKITDEQQTPDVVSTLDLEPGSDAWIVWVVWSTGDSFGFAEHSHYEVLGIFADSYSPSVFAKYIEEYEKPSDFSFNGPWRTEYHSDDGQVIEMQTYPAWDGYFERLNMVNISKVKVVE